MTRYWVLGFMVAIVVVMYLVRRSRKTSEPIDLPLREHERPGPLELSSEDVEPKDDTAPAVLSPPEWRPPKSTSNGS